ncbi:Nn.00g110020.m01.CDS01 [Neocucurbitaria sp. VM-36]
MTDTKSPQSAVTNAERGFHNTKAAYTLPNDNTEHSRLEAQSERLRDLMNNTLIHAPLKQNNIQKALDIGCGTGAVTHELASLFPNAQAYGVDLSPVPNIREKLPNITYIEGNFNDLVDSPDEKSHFEANSFDYIFSRFLVLGMTDWKRYVERCVSLLKPGGWLEMHDLDMSTHHVPHDITPTQRGDVLPHNLTLHEAQSNAHPTSSWISRPPWQTTFDKLVNAKGLDSTAGSLLPGLFADTGLQDVRIRRYLYPYSMWNEQTEEQKRFAKHHRRTLGDVMPMMIKRQGAGSDLVDEAELQRAIKSAEAERDEWDGGRSFAWVYVVCGQKAG